MENAQHLTRLGHVWLKQPVYFITTCIARRRPLLNRPEAHNIFREEWHGLKTRHGWLCGPYVIMPDHVHFFATPVPGEAQPLSKVVGKWKEWTAKRILAATGTSAPLWQPEFFDHALRSDASRTEKWNYMRENPVRAGLVEHADAWPYAGHIDFQ